MRLPLLGSVGRLGLAGALRTSEDVSYSASNWSTVACSDEELSSSAG